MTTDQSVDTGLEPVTLPGITEVPRESAVDTVALGELMLEVSLGYVKAMADIHSTVTVADLEAAVTTRRQLSLLTDVIQRRGLSRTATLAAQEATRRMERALGQLLRAAQEIGTLKKKNARSDAPTISQIIPTGQEKFLVLADGIDAETWEAALEKCRTDHGVLSWERVVSMFGDAALTVSQRERKALLAKLAGEGYSSPQIGDQMEITVERVRELARRWGITIPGDVVRGQARQIDMGRVMEESLATLNGVATSMGMIHPDHIAALEPEVAADYAHQMWTALVPIMGVRKGMTTRGNS